MRRAAFVLSVGALAGCAAVPQPAPPVPAPPRTAAPAAPTLVLRNAGFEAELAPDQRCAPGWDCTMHNDPRAFRFFLEEGGPEGRRYLCVERVHDEPWALVTQGFDGPAIRGARLRLSMAVRVEGASGEGAGPWALVQGNPPINPRRLVRGSAGWQRLSVEVAVPANRTMLELGATLEGPGKACFDDVRLEVLPPA